MITVDEDMIAEQHAKFIDAYQNSSSGALLQSKYFAKAFKTLEAEADVERLKIINKERKRAGMPEVNSPYPYKVKVPKSIDEMLNGDFQPARVIEVKEPIKGPYSNMWFGSTLKGVSIRPGYENGDSRKICRYALDDNTVHGFLGGATGQGKSVTLNSIIYGMCTEYAPWELTLTLSDAKIVEFKTIARNYPMPHVDIVAATGDADYMLSMLENKFNEMMKRQSVFTKAGEVFGAKIANIIDFREITGLTLPRVVMIFDECTAMFQNAGSKKAGKIAEILDKIARLGRNAGFHLLLTSQEVSSDLPQNTMANLSLRCAMGCDGPISERIIGNDAAVLNKGIKGRLIINSRSSQKNSEEFNTQLVVPYADDGQVRTIAEDTIAKGREWNVIPVLRFYDEEERLYQQQYEEILGQFEQRSNRILLGPPSFIMDDEEQIVRIELTGDNVENICAFANDYKNRIRMMEMLKCNFKNSAKDAHTFCLVDTKLAAEGRLLDIPHVDMVFEENNYESSTFFKLTKAVIYKRMLIVKTDKLAFSNNKVSETSEAVFNEMFSKGSEMDTPTNRCRLFHMISLLLNDQELQRGLGCDGKDMALVKKIATACFNMYKKYNCLQTAVTPSKLPDSFFWVIGIERMIGIIMDSKMKFVDDFKKQLQVCSTYHIRFIIFTDSFDEIGPLAQYFCAFLLEDLAPKQVNQIKAMDYYPPSLASGLMLLYNPKIANDKCIQKFKKLMLPGEM